MQAPIRLHDVCKSYGQRTAVRGLSLNVPAHSVYGFLGPNGAGKSTTIRMILGLQKPDRGSIALFGKPLTLASLARVGSMVESPSLYAHLTGRENLEVHRRLLNAPKTSIDEALDIVEMSPAADRAVRGYSSGMKQRLGLAQALLGDPELLLLDEPTNGLDPAGMHEIRDLIRELPKRKGVTIFLSSHLLAEVEQIATHFAIVAEGRLKFEGTAADLRRRNAPRIAAQVGDIEKALKVLEAASLIAIEDDGWLVLAPQSEHSAAEVNALLVRSGIAVSELTVRHQTLEDTFLELTSQEVAAQ